MSCWHLGNGVGVQPRTLRCHTVQVARGVAFNLPPHIQPTAAGWRPLATTGWRWTGPCPSQVSIPPTPSKDLLTCGLMRIGGLPLALVEKAAGARRLSTTAAGSDTPCLACLPAVRSSWVGDVHRFDPTIQDCGVEQLTIQFA